MQNKSDLSPALTFPRGADLPLTGAVAVPDTLRRSIRKNSPFRSIQRSRPVLGPRTSNPPKAPPPSKNLGLCVPSQFDPRLRPSSASLSTPHDHPPLPFDVPRLGKARSAVRLPYGRNRIVIPTFRPFFMPAEGHTRPRALATHGRSPLWGPPGTANSWGGVLSRFESPLFLVA